MFTLLVSFPFSSFSTWAKQEINHNWREFWTCFDYSIARLKLSIDMYVGVLGTWASEYELYHVELSRISYFLFY